MGLGKTLQSITILWTLMCQGFEGKPAVTHTIIACPVSLVTNWESEVRPRTARAPACAMVSHTGGPAHRRRLTHCARACARPPLACQIKTKWIGQERVKARHIDVIAVAEAKKDEVKAMVKREHTLDSNPRWTPRNTRALSLARSPFVYRLRVRP